MWLTTQRRKHQRELESVTPMPEGHHNIMRGRIAQINDLIKAVEPSPAPELGEEPQSYFDD